MKELFKKKENKNELNEIFDIDNFDEDNYMNNYEDEMDISKNKLSSKIINLDQQCIEFIYTLAGFTYTSNGDKLIYTGDALMGVESLKRSTQIIQSFSKEVNMITNKDNYKWAKQLMRTSLDFLSVIITARDIQYPDMRVIFRSFYNLLQNIGDIIINKNSQDIIKSYYNMVNQVKDNIDSLETKMEV